MPELDDIRSSEELAVADLASDDMVWVFDASTDRMKKVRAASLGSEASATNILEALQGAAEDPTKIGEEYISTSTNGGVDAIPRFDASGNFYTGPVDNRVDGVYLSSSFGSLGNIKIPDQQGILWTRGEDGATTAAIRHWYNHDNQGGETIIESGWRMAIIGRGPIQFGNNEINRTAQFLHVTSGQAKNTDTLRASKAISLQTATWSGSASQYGNIQFQAVPLDTSNTNQVLKFWMNTRVYGDLGIASFESVAGDITDFYNDAPGGGAAQIGEMSKKGFWNPGIHGEVVELDGSSEFTWTVSKYRTFETATVTLEGNFAMAWGGTLLPGMRGRLYVKQDATGSRKLLLPAGSLFAVGGYPDLSTAANAVDILEWDYDGVNTFWRFVAKEFATPAYPGAPTIAGTNAVGDTLTVTTGGVWSGYQWYSGASAVSGQTGTTYVIRHQDIGQDITCREGGVPSNIITAWHPDDETGYFADYRADLGLYQSAGGAAATTHGATVGEWQDQSGNSRHVANPTAGERPTLDLTTYAGYPHVRFDGGDYLYKVQAMTRPQTVFIVMESESLGANKRAYAAGASGLRMLIQHEVSGTGAIRNGAATTAASTFPINTRAIVMARTTSTQNTIRLNAGTEVVATESTGNGDTIAIGGSSSGNAITGRVFAVLVYMGDLDSTAQTKVRAYLKAKWNTP